MFFWNQYALNRKWGLNGDPKTEKGPHGDLGLQMGTHVGAVLWVCLGAPRMVHNKLSTFLIQLAIVFQHVVFYQCSNCVVNLSQNKQRLYGVQGGYWVVQGVLTKPTLRHSIHIGVSRVHFWVI